MNPLIKAARLVARREKREEWAICIGCGVVFALLWTMFLLKSTA